MLWVFMLNWDHWSVLKYYKKNARKIKMINLVPCLIHEYLIFFQQQKLIPGGLKSMEKIKKS